MTECLGFVQHLPPGYPKTAGDGMYQNIWSLAFEIHEVACRNPLSHKGIINPMPENSEFCDCYERAYQEYHTQYGEAGIRVIDLD